MKRTDGWDELLRAERAQLASQADDAPSPVRPARVRGPKSFFTLVLVILAAFLVFIIASGTIWAFVRAGVRSGGTSRTLLAAGKRNPVPGDVIAADPAGKTAVFSDIGLLRAATADKKIVTIVIQPYLPYPANDVPFREELVQKTRPARAFILNWFHTKKLKEIDKLGETGVKAALLEGINGLLVLGKIETIYFSEYMVIE